MARKVAVASVASNHAFASYENVLLAVFRSELGLNDAQAYVKLARDIVKATSQGLVVFSVYELGVPAPDGPSRQTVGEAIKHLPLLASAHVIEGNDLKATALRMGVSAFALIVPSKVPTKVVGSVGAASSWLATSVFENKLSAVELTRAMEEVRAAIPSPSR